MNSQPSTAVRRLFLPDTHVPYHDERALRIVREFAADFKPHDVIHLGDLIDVSQVSSHPKSPDSDLLDDFQSAERILDEFGVTHLALGNHEERLTRPGLVAPDLRKFFDPVRNLHLDERKIAWIPYDSSKCFKFGKLRALHGFFTNEYAARRHAEAFGCCVFGHTHRRQVHQPKTSRVTNTGFNIGCLCDLRPDYIRPRTPTGWVHAFAFGYFYKSGHFSLYVPAIVGRRITVNGKDYI